MSHRVGSQHRGCRNANRQRRKLKGELARGQGVSQEFFPLRTISLDSDGCDATLLDRASGCGSDGGRKSGGNCEVLHCECVVVEDASVDGVVHERMRCVEWKGEIIEQARVVEERKKARCLVNESVK